MTYLVQGTFTAIAHTTNARGRRRRFDSTSIDCLFSKLEPRSEHESLGTFTAIAQRNAREEKEIRLNVGGVLALNTTPAWASSTCPSPSSTAPRCSGASWI